MVALLAGGCSAAQGPGGPENNVFGTFGAARSGQSGGYTHGVAPTGVIINFSINSLHNYSDSPVTLRSVHLTTPAGPAIHVTNIRAYLISQVGLGQLVGEQGDLAKNCGRPMTPHPVTDVTVQPHSDSSWMVVIALVYKHPGRYPFGRVRITYTAGGRRGWQNYYVGDIRVTAVSRQKDPQLVDPPTSLPPAPQIESSAY